MCFQLFGFQQIVAYCIFEIATFSIYIAFNLCIPNLFNILCSLISGRESHFMNTVKVLFNAAHTHT
jgi:hypothetical protein